MSPITHFSSSNAFRYSALTVMQQGSWVRDPHKDKLKTKNKKIGHFPRLWIPESSPFRLYILTCFIYFTVSNVSKFNSLFPYVSCLSLPISFVLFLFTWAMGPDPWISDWKRNRRTQKNVNQNHNPTLNYRKMRKNNIIGFHISTQKQMHTYEYYFLLTSIN